MAGCGYATRSDVQFSEVADPGSRVVLCDPDSSTRVEGAAVDIQDVVTLGYSRGDAFRANERQAAHRHRAQVLTEVAIGVAGANGQAVGAEIHHGRSVVDINRGGSRRGGDTRRGVWGRAAGTSTLTLYDKA